MASSLREMNKAKVIICFGDSITAPRGELKVYAMILQEELPKFGIQAEVINAGVGGHTSADGLLRFEKDVLTHKPDCVVILFGTNDAAIDVWRGETEPRVPLGKYRRNLKTMINRLKEHGSAVILITPPPWDLHQDKQLTDLYWRPPYSEKGENFLLEQYAAAARDLAAELKILCIDLYRILSDPPKGKNLGDFMLDGCHPNAAGQEVIAGEVIKEVRRLF